jgi:hypothetical protein
LKIIWIKHRKYKDTIINRAKLLLKIKGEQIPKMNKFTWLDDKLVENDTGRIFAKVYEAQRNEWSYRLYNQNNKSDPFPFIFQSKPAFISMNAVKKHVEELLEMELVDNESAL